MGSCCSGETNPADDRSPPGSRFRARHHSHRSKSNASHDASLTEHPVQTLDAPVGVCPAASLPVFDEAVATAVEIDWFRAGQQCSAFTPRARSVMSAAFGETEKQRQSIQASFSDARLFEAFLARQGPHGVHVVSGHFDSCSRPRSSGRVLGTPEGGMLEAEDTHHHHDEPCLDAEGIQRLGDSLGIRTDPELLFFLYVLGCTDGPWNVPKSRFVAACVAHACLDMGTLKLLAADCCTQYPTLSVSDSAFADFYRWLFAAVKPAPSARCLAPDVALTVWEEVLVPKWNGGRAWCDFVQAQANPKPVFRDLWMQVGTFAATVTWPDCREADHDASWPSLIDSFIDASRHPQPGEQPA
jgi:hypothetical protein